MNIDDMADLIDVYNAVQELGAVVAEVYEASVYGLFSDSIYGRLLKVERILFRNSVPEMEFEADVDFPIGHFVLSNKDYSSNDKALVLLGYKRKNQIPDKSPTE